MTGLRKWRKFARSFIVFSIAGEVIFTIAGLVFLILLAVRGSVVPSADDLVNVVGTLALFAVVSWAIWDARRRTRRQPSPRVAAVEQKA